MKFLKKKVPRKFSVGNNKKVILKDFGKIYLNSNEQLTFVKNKSEFDIVKKNWGYYATPSINNRLKKFNFRSFIVINSSAHIYIMIVHKNKIKEFKKYLKSDKAQISKELTNGYNIKFK